MSVIKKISSIETRTVPLEIEVPVDMYQTSDGKKFKTEDGAIEHERKIENDSKKKAEKKEAEKYITPITPAFGDNDNSIISIIFNGYDVSSSYFFKWTATKDVKIIRQVAAYLHAENCGINSDELKKFAEQNDGEVILIASWAESEGGDNPTYETKGILLNDAIKIIDGISYKLKNI